MGQILKKMVNNDYKKQIPSKDLLKIINENINDFRLFAERSTFENQENLINLLEDNTDKISESSFSLKKYKKNNEEDLGFTIDIDIDIDDDNKNIIKVNNTDNSKFDIIN